jgi:hypothetical protein
MAEPTRIEPVQLKCQVERTRGEKREPLLAEPVRDPALCLYPGLAVVGAAQIEDAVGIAANEPGVADAKRVERLNRHWA